MKIIKEKSKWFTHIFVFDYREDIVEFCRGLKMKYGFDKINYVVYPQKGWGFSNRKIAEEIIAKYPSIVVESNDFGEEKIEVVTPSPKISLNSDFDTKTKLPLYKFQKEAIDFMRQCNGLCMNASEMGTGKSATTIAYANLMNYKTLVICPSSVKLLWQDEISKFTNRTSTVLTANILNRKKLIDINKYDFVIMNYEIVGKAIRKGMDFQSIDLIVLDESHRIKNIKAMRSKSVHQLKFIPHRVCLTGTPILNRPAELFSQLNFIAPSMFPNAWKFYSRYADLHRTYFGWDMSGASHLNELRERIKGIMFRRTKADVLPELPAKIETLVRINLSPSDRIKYQQTFMAFERILFLRGAQSSQLAKLTYLKQICSEAKIKNAIEIIDNIIESGQKVVIFSQYLNPLHILKKKYGNTAVILEGSMKEKDKKESIDKFQKDDKVKVFLGSIMAAGFGISLTKASNCIFLDLPFVPSVLAQASDRVYRIGTKKSVNIYYLIVENSIEIDIYNLLKQKMDVIKTLLNEEEILKIKSASIFPALIKRLKTKKNKK